MHVQKACNMWRQGHLCLWVTSVPQIGMEKVSPFPSLSMLHFSRCIRRELIGSAHPLDPGELSSSLCKNPREGGDNPWGEGGILIPVLEGVHRSQILPEKNEVLYISYFWKNIEFKGTMSQDCLSGPIWTGKGGFAKFFILWRCSLATRTLCQLSRWLCGHTNFKHCNRISSKGTQIEY